MIASLRGTVTRLGLNEVVLEVGNIGYRVVITPRTASTLSPRTDAFLYTLQTFREDAQTLYGFTDLAEQELFILLQKVTGLGPKLALASLAVFDPAQLVGALSVGDAKALTKIPGVGASMAAKMVFELQNKVTPAGAPAGTSIPPGSPSSHIIEALEGLGFSTKQAASAVEKVTAGQPDAAESVLLREALRLLGK